MKEMKSPPQVVTVDNFCRAETDNYFRLHAADAGGIGVFKHLTEPTQVDYQPVVRMNRDTLYSMVVLDLTEPATITFPDSGDRFMSMILINEDHYIPFVTYDAGKHTLTQDAMRTRYVEAIFRVFVNPDDPEDVKKANALQNALKVKQKSPGVLELPSWDQQSLDACRKELMDLGPFVPDSHGTFGDVDEVDEVRHLIGTARGWGGNREEDAFYQLVTSTKNDGKTPYILKMTDVPVDGFWSISMYNGQGYFEKNEYGAYSLNNVTATPDADGSYTIHFGGDPKASNFLYIMPGWNITIRYYRPRPELLDGSWPLPELAPA